MNKVFEEFKIPGYKTSSIIVPREKGNRKNIQGKSNKALQLELSLESDSC